MFWMVIPMKMDGRVIDMNRTVRHIRLMLQTTQWRGLSIAYLLLIAMAVSPVYAFKNETSEMLVIRTVVSQTDSSRV